MSPILDSTEAISRTLELLPAGISYSEVNVRRVLVSDLDSWRESSSPYSDQASVAWAVGLRAPNLTVADVFPEYYETGSTSGMAGHPVEGLYYAFDAGSGALLGRGGLDPTTSQSFSALSQIPETVSPIETAEIPFEPTIEPSATP
jgi:hypothetical protein